MIDHWFYEKGYDKFEAKNIELDLPTGKEIDMEILPSKKTTDYFKNIIRIRIKFSQIKDIELEKEKEVLKVQKGRVMMIFDGYLESDYENEWESKPLFYFLRTIYDKFILKSTFSYYERWLVNDIYDLHSRIQRNLNIYRYEKKA